MLTGIWLVRYQGIQQKYDLFYLSFMTSCNRVYLIISATIINDTNNNNKGILDFYVGSNIALNVKYLIKNMLMTFSRI